MKALLTAVASVILMAAAPPQTLRTTTPMPEFSGSQSATTPAPATPQGYTLAPTPDSDVSAPITRASKDASLGPGFFARRDQYRGEGLSPGSSAQIEQDRRAKPGAGISLRMPLQ